jgi:predicted aspartyl protease
MFLALCALGLAVSSTPVEIRANYPILPDVYVNGKGPFRMLVDTGAQSTSLRPRLTDAAGLRPTFAVELQRVGGTSVVPVAKARRVSVGGLDMEEVEVLLAEPPNVKSLGPLDGVVGQSFLSRTNYWLDYGGRKIVWDPDGKLVERLEGNRVPFEFEDGRPAVQAKVGRDQRRLVLDSGASHLILFTENGKGAPAARVDTLDLGGQRWRGIPAAVLASAQTGGGLLPGHLLKSFYVNNRKQYVLVEPRASALCANGPAELLAHRAAATDTGW